MNAEQYKLAMYALSLNSERDRDHALEKAKEYYYLGHNLKYVRTLIAEARLHNHKMMRLRRVES